MRNCKVSNVDCKMKGARTQEGISDLKFDISKQIKQWAADNDWYKVDVTTNQLRLEQTFGHAIETVTKDLDRQNQSKMRRQVFDCFDHLSAKCRQIDMVCRTGCRSESEMLELEFLRGKAVGAAAELSEVVRIIQNSCHCKLSIVDCKMPEKKQKDLVNDEWITFAQAAEIIGVAKGTISKWTTAGKFKDNGQTGQKRRLLKTSVLLIKQKIEDEFIKRDVKELREDARKLKIVD